jgi:SAM-dependent methyltransferase
VVDDVGDDPIATFYDRHPYPPPVTDLDALAAGPRDEWGERVEHHLIWPARRPDTVSSVLVAGCGTSQAVRHALRRPGNRIVAIDVSSTAIDHTRQLTARHGVSNIQTRLLPIEQVHELGQEFDHIVCTGVLHHLADPTLGLSRLRDVLAPGGAITLMVYGRYGRFGVYLLQDYCRRLGITPEPGELADLVATLRELPDAHPLGRLLRESRDFHSDDALADALLNPRDRAYSVPELFDLLAGAGLRFGRWTRQAPYLPDCGSISETPHAARIAALPQVEQYAAVELFRGTIARHTAIAYDAADETSGRLDFDGPTAEQWVPLRAQTTIAVGERLPAGAAAALLNRAHTEHDLVLFVNEDELGMFEAIDGDRPIGALGQDARPFIERLWRHDLVVIDSSADAGSQR